MNNNQVTTESFAVSRGHVAINPGDIFTLHGTSYRIRSLIGCNDVLAVGVEDGRNRIFPVGIIAESDIQEPLPFCNADLEDISDEEWGVINKRFKIIKPLLELAAYGRNEVEAVAEEAGLSPSTIYRWLKSYHAHGVMTALMPRRRGWVEGASRISKQADAVIQKVIEDLYLTKQRVKVEVVVRQVQLECADKGLASPSPGTIRARIARISLRRKLRERGYAEQARNKFTPVPGRFPNANCRLAVVQIDHTPLDIILVDDEHRKPIGRPTLTLAVDVHTRMITGYYLSLDAPSETSVAMCMAHSILPKQEWLDLHGVDAQWPVWGLPQTVHVDNGADFRSNTFRKACEQYGINLEYRPVKQPRYGGHIERLLGTILREIHGLPGTTFSSIRERDGYDSEKHAVMTKDELEKWLVSFITKVYHQREHSGIGLTPTEKWEISCLGDDEVVGVGLPPIPKANNTILLDFLPSFMRTVQPFGVTIDNISYYAEALRPWINATEDGHRAKKREFVFRRDPRDISCIWFYDPVIKEYFKIQAADQTIPPVSLWEYKQLRASFKKQGRKIDSTIALKNGLEELRNIVDESSAATKKARKESQRRKEHEKKEAVAVLKPSARVAPSESKPTFSSALSASIDEIESYAENGVIE